MNTYCSRPAANPIKTGNRVIDFILVVLWFILPGAITVVLTLMYINNIYHSFDLLIVDFFVCDLIASLLPILITLNFKYSGKGGIEPTRIYDIYFLGTLWYLSNLASSIRLTKELDYVYIIMGILPSVIFTLFTVVAGLVYHKCCCRHTNDKL